MNYGRGKEKIIKLGSSGGSVQLATSEQLTKRKMIITATGNDCFVCFT